MGAHISVPMYRRTLPQRLRLEGQRCGGCGRLQFPPVAACPACWGDRLEPFRFSGQGVVHAVTRIAPAGAPPEFTAQARAEGGYWVAIVQLEEGPRITAQLTAPAGIGQAVRTVIRQLYTEEGVVRYGFKFAPVAAPDGGGGGGCTGDSGRPVSEAAQLPGPDLPGQPSGH